MVGGELETCSCCCGITSGISTLPSVDEFLQLVKMAYKDVNIHLFSISLISSPLRILSVVAPVNSLKFVLFMSDANMRDL